MTKTTNLRRTLAKMHALIERIHENNDRERRRLARRAAEKAKSAAT